MSLIKVYNKKTILNALYLFVSAVILFLSAISIPVSQKEQSCNNEVNFLLISKTQSFVEKQHTLFSKTWATDTRNINIIRGDEISAKFWNEEARQYNNEYLNFLNESFLIDIQILEQLSECKTWSKYTTYLNLITVISAVFASIISVCYLRKYV